MTPTPNLDTAVANLERSPEYIECKALTVELVNCERRVEELKYRLAELWKRVPSLPVPRYRICMNCKEYTLERFSKDGHTGCVCCTPMCIKHNKGMDLTARRLLAELISGG